MKGAIKSYLEKAWGDSVENVTIKDIQDAIAETQAMDDEHGAFWVSLFINDENVLEAHKDLLVIGIFEDEPDNEYRSKFPSWQDVENLYKTFMKLDFPSVKVMLEKNKVK